MREKIILVHNEKILASMYKTKLESGGYEVEIIDPKDYTPNQLLEFIKKENKNMENYPFEIGQSYFIRTATYHCTGKVKAIKSHFLVLEDGAWIADSGRFNEAINNGSLSEVEPVNVEMGVNIDSIIDYFVWNHPLPREVK